MTRAKMLTRMVGTALAMGSLAVAATTTASADDPVAPPGAIAPQVVAGSLASLPAGAPPRGYAYGIGKRLFLNGRTYDLSAYWSKIAPKGYNDPTVPQEFLDVDQTRGVMLWAFRYFAVDSYVHVGNLVPGQAPKLLVTQAADPPIATTSGGFIGLGMYNNMGGVGSSIALNYSGFISPPRLNAPIENAVPAAAAMVSSATSALVVNVEYDSALGAGDFSHKSWLYYPTHGQIALPYANTYAAGDGQLVTRDSFTGGCWRSAALASPATLRARVCSQVYPKVNADGTRIAVVQGSTIRLFNAATGAPEHWTTAPSLSTWDSSHFYTLLGWEDASNYLVKARNGTELYILRCNVSGACERAVTSTVRTGVSSIVT